MDVVIVSAPLFALMLIGYLGARFGLIPIEAIKGLNNYVLYFALTAMLFRIGSTSPLEDALNPIVIGIWLVSCWSVMAIAIAYGRTKGRTWLDSSFGGLAASLPNSGFMGIALVTAIMGAQHAHLVVPVILTEMVVLQGSAIAFSQLDLPQGTGLLTKLKASFSGVFANPIVWGIGAGVIWGATGWALPSVLDDIIGILADSATPVALFTVGAVLYREQRRAATEPSRSSRTYIAIIAVLKVIALPLIVWGLGRMLMSMGVALTSEQLATLVLIAALPGAANTTILAEKYGADSGLIATALLVTSTVGFVTFNGAAALVA